MNDERYSRQVLFSPIGRDGQEKLNESSVLIIGAGALGTVVANHLVRAGVGKIRIVDRDYVEPSNLQRQMLYTEEDASRMLPKAVAAKQRLSVINSSVEVEAHVMDVTAEQMEKLTTGVDIIIDGTDNFSTRYIINDASFKYNIPFSYGGAVSSRGMTAFFVPGKTPCLRCIIPDGAGNGQTCDTAGVIAPVVDMVASLQVTEAIKWLTDNKGALRNDLYSFDLWKNTQFSMKLSNPRKQCTTCQTKEYPYLSGEAGKVQQVLCGRDTIQFHHRHAFDLEEWANTLGKVAEVKHTPFLIKAEIDDGIHLVLFSDGRVLVQGTTEVAKARSYYDRFIGS
ncbi:ThiF family adenylyltransferase [Thalassobacillus hwangdonensis]|uniref:ThiF family adenylyltransferase n=1 Tax=Thalassobacillus hwangdonensis TaxID=546108 RepID=A0ABW3KYM8_9BACI